MSAVSLPPNKNLFLSPCRPFEPHVYLFRAACKGTIQGPSGETNFKKHDLQMDHVKPEMKKMTLEIELFKRPKGE